MPLMTWNESMSTGVAELDAQHKEIFRGVNELHQAMLAGHAREELGKTLTYLAQYAAMHFAKEEECMTKYHCPAAAANMNAHRAFVRKVGVFQEQLKADGATAALVLALRQELADWLNSHICKIDTQLAASAAAPKAA